MSRGFIKNEELLEETHEVTDLLDFSELCNQFNAELKSINNSSLIGLIGEFGMGKSTMLFQLLNNQKDGAKWVYFEAWKYPERSNLWEGFVLDFVSQINQDLFNKIKSKVDGQEHRGVRAIFKSISKILGTIYPPTSFIETFANLFKSSPIKRVFEFQEVLEKFINENVEDNTIYVIIEDIDRSGDKGVFFLETLKQFIKTAKLNKKVIGIVPVSTYNFNSNKESYLKSLDYRHDFNPGNINFSKLTEKTFKNEIINKETRVKQINYLLQRLSTVEKLTIRHIKNLIRNTNTKYKSLPRKIKDEIDVRVMLGISVAFQIRNNNITSKGNGVTVLKNDLSWLKNYMIMISHNTYNLKELDTNLNLIFNNENNMKPELGQRLARKIGSNVTENAYFLSIKYLNL